MNNNDFIKKNKRRDFVLSASFSFALFLSILPSFASIGKLEFQVLSTLILSVIIAGLSLFFKNGVRAMGISLLAFLSVMFIWCVAAQLVAQIRSTEPFKQWIYIFYYDKPMTVALAWAGVFFTYTFIRLFLPINNKYTGFIEGYASFLKTSVSAFLVFYLFLLLYGFVIIRTSYGYSSEVNLVPFKSILSYFNGEISFYESFMYFSGNLLIFAPLGFFFSIFINRARWYVLLPLPIILSSSIEYSQHILQNGICDIDDVILNCLGFYLGVLLFKAFNQIRRIITKGEETTIFRR
jgi:glycopeptide antibiotics resistance protein